MAYDYLSYSQENSIFYSVKKWTEIDKYSGMDCECQTYAVLTDRPEKRNGDRLYQLVLVHNLQYGTDFDCVYLSAKMTTVKKFLKKHFDVNI